MILTSKQLSDFKSHILECYPHEGCGLIVNNEFMPCENIHEHPDKSFAIDPTQLILGHAAVLHSHPYKLEDKFEKNYNPAWPSLADQEYFQQDDKPWIIVSCDGEGISKPVILDDTDIQPLLGREFIWYQQDCYSIIRDYYRLYKNVNLYNLPREFGFWEKGQNLYVDNFKKWGFEQISVHEAGIGDVVIINLGQNAIPTHGGIISNDNTLLHHLPFKLSGEEPLSRWHRSIVLYLRYQE